MTGVTKCCDFRVACDTREKRICDTRLADMLTVQVFIDKCRHRNCSMDDNMITLANSRYRNVTDSLTRTQKKIQIRFIYY